MENIEIIIHDGKKENKAIVQIFNDYKKIAELKFSSKEEIEILTAFVDGDKVKVQRIP